ncbi:STY4851/ECs_5259 family protein [Pseudomonas fontis]|uniref:STY4851/ECs_5259 family protein n=1 Tax=Pseudomonas fontis TaxID=2942633 RepID=A0ABT5NNF4_9PSED|nr:STY4851/ECs_5259 family protein [Pseudomonas fontis]MDD0973189.1 STY4851/ECs_5259 family protein [Pseudomonas fontis]MDD0989679.1 STY4851/ECs_5259 family protein [Pseudomonas fontis]
MELNAPATTAAKAWLSELLFIRTMFKGPDGKPLYSYHVTESEYRSLIEMLSSYFRRGSVQNYSTHLAACFCLFVSEQYRRDYNSSWSWSGPETLLGISLSPQQHASLTSSGLAYWSRPIRFRENSRDWLGSLFAEGGLPWPLVQSESHGFGRAVRRGIKHFYRTEGNRRTTADLMADFENELPLIFRNLETRRLLAGIVDQLMYLVEHYPLKDQQDPANYLDKVAPGWTDAFPIPLDESNSRTLLNDWLRDAGQKRQERKEALEKARVFTCEHFLYGTLPQWLIRTELILPQEATFVVDPTSLGSTRLELAYYEGERLLARGPAVYGQLTEQGFKVRFSNPQVTLERRRLDEPLSLRLLDNGRMVHCQFFDGSALDYHDIPLIFENRSERWQLVASSSCSLSSGLVRLRVPPGFATNCEGGAANFLLEDQENGLWLEANVNLSLVRGDDHYQVELNQADNDDAKPTLTGIFALYESSPAMVYLGWPNLELPEGYPHAREDLLEFVNGELLDRQRSSRCGSARYTLRTRSGKTLLQRRFGVLPRDFNLSLFPGVREQPARLQIKGVAQLDLHVVSNALVVERDENSLYMRHQGEAPPSTFVLELGQGLPSLQLHLPYPYQGARLLDQYGNPSRARELILADLMGHRISLTSGLTQGQNFHMQLELICAEQPHPQRTYSIRVGSAPVMLNLFSYLGDMQNMLGAVDEQDAYIRFSLETEQPLLKLDIRRYGGQLQWEGRHAFYVSGVSNTSVLDGVQAEAMLLSDPKRTPLQLTERTSEAVGIGSFEIPQAMQPRGPWLIYPAESSSIRFRPALYVVPVNGLDTAAEICSLHRAAEVFHPEHNPHAIDQQIAAMAYDFNHSGWQYLADLKQNYRHLPLSSFETWKALSRNQEALSFSVFRLEMDESFCARIRDELSVIWETIPLPLWAQAYRLFQDYMRLTGLPDALVNTLVSKRAEALRCIVSGFDYLGDYLSTGNCSSLKKLPLEQVLPAWYQGLRHLHEANRNWPTLLGSELSSWIDRQLLPPLVKALSLAEFTDAVAYLPIFMAFVTAGRAKITDLPATPAYLKFAIRLVADFDRQGWFIPVHALVVSYLLASQNEA